MSVDAYQGILVVAVFFSVIAWCFSAFVFSAVAGATLLFGGAILLQVRSPASTIPLLTISSPLIEGYVLLRLSVAKLAAFLAGNRPKMHRPGARHPYAQHDPAALPLRMGWTWTGRLPVAEPLAERTQLRKWRQSQSIGRRA